MSQQEGFHIQSESGEEKLVTRENTITLELVEIIKKQISEAESLLATRRARRAEFVDEVDAMMAEIQADNLDEEEERESSPDPIHTQLRARIAAKYNLNLEAIPMPRDALTREEKIDLLARLDAEDKAEKGKQEKGARKKTQSTTSLPNRSSSSGVGLGGSGTTGP